MGEFRQHWGPTSLAALAALAALFAVASFVYGSFHPVVDHVVYRAQAEALRDGEVTLPVDPGRPPLVFTAVRGDEAVVKYLPGTAAVGAVSLLVTGGVGLATGGALVLLVVAVSGLGRAAGLSPWARAAAGLAVGLSPVVLALDARLLSYVPGAALATAAAWAVVEAVRRPVWWPALVGGVLLGAALWFRQLEVVAWAVVLVAWLVWASGSGRAAAVRVGALVAGTVPALVGIALYDRRVTGAAATLPFVYVSPEDGPGFGLRRALPVDPYVRFDLLGGVRAAVAGMWTLLPWAAAGLALAVGAVLALRRPARSRVTPLLVGLLAVVPVAFVVQWSHKNALRGGHYDGVGPFYLLFALPPLAVLGVVGLRTLRDRRLLVGVVAAAVVVQAALLWAPVARQADLTDEWAAFDRGIEALPAGTVVLVDAAYQGQPFTDLVAGRQGGGTEVVEAVTPAAIFSALDRWPGRPSVQAVTDLDVVWGREVPVPGLVPLTVPAAAASQRGSVALRCADGAAGGEVELVLGDAAAEVPCGTTAVELGVASGRAEVRVGGRTVLAADVPEGASTIDVCARRPGGGARETVCRHVPVERSGDQVRWVLPGRLDPDAGVRGLADLLGPVTPSAPAQPSPASVGGP